MIENQSTQQFLMLTEDEIADELAKRAKALRINKKMTQEDFCEKSGIAFSTYTKFERTGKISLIGFLTVARYLGRLKDIESILKLDDVEKLGLLNVSNLNKARSRSRVKHANKRVDSKE